MREQAEQRAFTSL